MSSGDTVRVSDEMTVVIPKPNLNFGYKRLQIKQTGKMLTQNTFVCIIHFL
jgi:hypothetical protein